MQENSKCMFYGDKKTVNHINHYSKLVQKEYKTRYDKVGKMIY